MAYWYWVIGLTGGERIEILLLMAYRFGGGLINLLIG